MKTNTTKQGFVLTAVMMLIVIASLVGGAFLVSARGTNVTLERWKEYDECLLAVQAGLEAVNYSMYTNLLNDVYENGNRRGALQVLANQDFSVEVEVTDSFSPAPPPVGGASVGVGGASVQSGSSVTVTVTVASGAMYEDASENRSEVVLTCAAKATYGSVTRAVQELVDYDYNGTVDLPRAVGSRDVFNYAYFIANQGKFNGVDCKFNGDVGSNKDIDLQYSSIRVQGDLYAAGDFLSPQIYQSYNWTEYSSQNFAGIYFSDKVRPALYTDFNTANPDTYYEQGYDNDGVTFYGEQEILDLPFIGPLSDYEDYAIAVGGTISDASNTVSGVWGDDSGEDAGSSSALDQGSLVLIGTAADPIDISGVVVAQNDIYIKGYYSGKGTLYAGRNIFVIGDLQAVDGPTWPHPDSNPVATAESNKNKDFMGLCAKGSLIFGSYAKMGKEEIDGGYKKYLKEPHTNSHASDVTDGALGYVKHYVDGEPFFNGDYTLPDGNGSELRTDGSLRHFYEPILSDAEMTALGVSDKVRYIDAVLYANHLVGGEFDDNAVLNGGLVCRDEAVVRDGNLAINWDARLGSQTMDGQAFFGGLPGMMLPAPQPMPSRTIQWAEVEPW